MSTDPSATIGNSGCIIPHLITKTLLLHLQGEPHQMERSELLMAFAGSLLQGKLHGGRAPTGTVIETMLREVARFLDSRGLGDPRRSTLG
jgi:hypothetical protein